MKIQPTIFIVTDIETTLKKRIAFDVAWKAIDRKGNVYRHGSYLSKDSVNLDAPWFKEKVGHYYQDVFDRKINPVKWQVIRFMFNKHIRELREDGHRVIFAAYNAKFDATELGKTSNIICGKPFLTETIELLDIWHYWSLTCPRQYRARPTETGKNLSTSAESVYRYEFGNDAFIERHIAYSDVEIEAEILLRVLNRKKPMPVVAKPSQFESRPWQIANDRVNRVDLKESTLIS